MNPHQANPCQRLTLATSRPYLYQASLIRCATRINKSILTTNLHRKLLKQPRTCSSKIILALSLSAGILAAPVAGMSTHFCKSRPLLTKYHFLDTPSDIAARNAIIARQPAEMWMPMLMIGTRLVARSIVGTRECWAMRRAAFRVT